MQHDNDYITVDHNVDYWHNHDHDGVEYHHFHARRVHDDSDDTHFIFDFERRPNRVHAGFIFDCHRGHPSLHGPGGDGVADGAGCGSPIHGCGGCGCGADRMSDLEKALEAMAPNFVRDDQGFLIWEVDEDEALVFDAARRFASLTSPETIGTVVAAHVETEEHTEVVVRLPRAYAAELVRSGDRVFVLRAVAGVEEGNNE